MREQVFLAGDIVRHACWTGRFPGVNVQSVLALFGKADRESHHVVVGDRMRDVFGEAFFFDAIFVQRRHKVGERSRHPKLNLQLASREDQGLLIDRTEKSSVRRAERVNKYREREIRQIYCNLMGYWYEAE